MVFAPLSSLPSSVKISEAHALLLRLPVYWAKFEGEAFMISTATLQSCR
jgi:hypothetical protein